MIARSRRMTALMPGLASAVLLAALLGPTLAQAAPGDRDPSFGTGGSPNSGISRLYGRRGLVTTDFGSDHAPGTSDSLHSIAIDSHGRVVAAGNTNERVALARYR